MGVLMLLDNPFIFERVKMERVVLHSYNFGNGNKDFP